MSRVAALGFIAALSLSACNSTLQSSPQSTRHDVQDSSPRIKWSRPISSFDVPKRLSGGSADVDGDFVAWISSAKRGGLARYALWLQQQGKRHVSLKVMKPNVFAAAVSISHPFVSWVEYQEQGNTAGAWAIYLHDLRTRRTRALAEWKPTAGSRHQSIPLPYMSDHTVVWHQLVVGSAKPEACIMMFDIQLAELRATECSTDLESYPHWARIVGGVVSYKINSGSVPGAATNIVEPRSPQHPQLADLFAEGGQLSGWRFQTHAVEADHDGVAWIAWGPSYEEKGGTFYWPGEGPVLSRPEVAQGQPPNEMMLLDDAIVWGEPDTNVFAVKRELLDCESAAVRLSADWFKQHYRPLRGHAIELYGASNDEILISLIRQNPKGDYPVILQVFAVFEIPDLPSSC